MRLVKFPDVCSAYILTNVAGAFNNLNYRHKYGNGKPGNVAFTEEIQKRIKKIEAQRKWQYGHYNIFAYINETQSNVVNTLKKLKFKVKGSAPGGHGDYKMKIMVYTGHVKPSLTNW